MALKLETWAELSERQRQRNTAEKRALLEAAAQQEGHRQLAAYALGITEASFNALCKRLGADLSAMETKGRGRRLILSKARIEATARLPLSEAGKQFGVTGAAISKARTRYGIKSTKENDQ